MDSLPERTALGYIELPDGKWKTNVYSLPVKGGSDGGAFVTAKGVAELWDALWNGRLLKIETTNQLLTPHTSVNESISYGYGIWMKHENRSISKYYLMGYDPGVNFRAAFYPEKNIKVVICSNQ